LVEREAIEQRGVQPGRAPRLHVAGVGLQDLRGPRLERTGDRVQRGVLGAGRQRGERPRGVAGGQAQLGDRGRAGGGGSDRWGGFGHRPITPAARRGAHRSPDRIPVGCGRWILADVRLGIADHLGWAIAVTASADHEVVDRRRIELVEPGISSAPIHYESRHLDVGAMAALVAQVRASAARATSAALDEIATALPAAIVSISLRDWPPGFPDDIAVQRRAPYEARADAIMYRQVLSELARDRNWEVHFYDARDVVDRAVGIL